MILLKSSSYNICIGNALLVTTASAYGIYATHLDLLWNLYGMVWFTLSEYLFHRFILHFVNSGTIYHYLHGKHHMKPRGRSIHIPILYTLTTRALSFATLYYFFTPSATYNCMFAWELSYIFFEHIHREIHHPSLFPSDQEKFRVFHMYHHLTNKHMAYSFSVPTWDILFDTFPLDAMGYNMFALIPIPFLSFYYGTYISSGDI